MTTPTKPVDAETALPDFVRRPIEQAIHAATHPQGVGVHDGKIRGLASDKVAYLLSAYDRLATLVTPPAPAAVPAGWMLVPVQPTKAMRRAGAGAHRSSNAGNAAQAMAEAYCAMLAATPPPPEPTPAPAAAVDVCACGERPISQCPGKWGPGCDLGANEKFVQVYEQTMEEREALNAAVFGPQMPTPTKPVDAAEPSLSEQLSAEATWLRSGNRFRERDWLDARLKETADLLRDASDAIATPPAPAAVPAGWMPIETAPTSELESFLVQRPGNSVCKRLVQQVSRFEGWLYPEAMDGNVDFDDRITDAVAWMPLPAAPGATPPPEPTPAPTAAVEVECSWVPMHERAPDPGTECVVIVRYTLDRTPFATVDKWDVQREDPTGMGAPTLETGCGWNDNYEADVIAWQAIPPYPPANWDQRLPDAALSQPALQPAGGKS